MARAIDADRLLLVLEKNFGHTGGAAVMRQLIEIQPTLPQPSNEALTLEELRGMDGEPVFVQWTDNRILPRWYIVGCYEWNLMDFDAFEDYGKWLAYRRPPEGEA